VYIVLQFTLSPYSIHLPTIPDLTGVATRRLNNVRSHMQQQYISNISLLDAFRTIDAKTRVGNRSRVREFASVSSLAMGRSFYHTAPMAARYKEHLCEGGRVAVLGDSSSLGERTACSGDGVPSSTPWGQKRGRRAKLHANPFRQE